MATFARRSVDPQNVAIRYSTDGTSVAATGQRRSCRSQPFGVASESRQKSLDGRIYGHDAGSQGPPFSAIEGAMESPATALVVEPSVAERHFVVSSLSELGFRVTVSDNFRDAKAHLVAAPTLLVTELRLGEYNGLHLVFRAKSLRSDMAAIIRTQIADPLLQLEAERMGATFVPKTTTAVEFRAAVCRTVFGRPDSIEPIRPPFERRHGERRSSQDGSSPHAERRLGERRVGIGTIMGHRSPS